MNDFKIIHIDGHVYLRLLYSEKRVEGKLTDKDGDLVSATFHADYPAYTPEEELLNLAKKGYVKLLIQRMKLSVEEWTEDAT